MHFCLSPYSNKRAKGDTGLRPWAGFSHLQKLMTHLKQVRVLNFMSDGIFAAQALTSRKTPELSSHNHNIKFESNL